MKIIIIFSNKLLFAYLLFSKICAGTSMIPEPTLLTPSQGLNAVSRLHPGLAIF